MSKTIIISNRLPVQLQISDGGLEAIPSVGGLATGMKSVHSGGESLWIGWSGPAAPQARPLQDGDPDGHGIINCSKQNPATLCIYSSRIGELLEN